VGDALTTNETERALEFLCASTCIVCTRDVEFWCERCRQGICRHCVRYADDEILCAACTDGE